VLTVLLSALMAIPTNANAIARVVVTSSFTGLLVDCPQSGIPCTDTTRTQLQGNTENARRLLFEVATPASAPTAPLLGIGPAAASAVVGAARECGKPWDFGTIARAFYGSNLQVTDVYPETDVQIYFADGTIATLHSESQRVYGLPWTIQYGNAVFRSYNSRISLVVALMEPGPGNSVLSSDLIGVDLPTDLVQFACRK